MIVIIWKTDIKIAENSKNEKAKHKKPTTHSDFGLLKRKKFASFKQTVSHEKNQAKMTINIPLFKNQTMKLAGVVSLSTKRSPAHLCIKYYSKETFKRSYYIKHKFNLIST